MYDDLNQSLTASRSIGGGGHAWQGVCMAGGGMHGRGVCMLGGGGMRGRGSMCGWGGGGVRGTHTAPVDIILDTRL